jgi:hypothetical protein
MNLGDMYNGQPSIFTRLDLTTLLSWRICMILYPHTCYLYISFVYAIISPSF